jgi:hypothetical protein
LVYANNTFTPIASIKELIIITDRQTLLLPV